MSTLLGLITNLNPSSGSAEGSFSLNGIPMGSRSLGERVAYVSNGELYGHLTVKQHLDLACAFLKPATNAFRAKHMVHVVQATNHYVYLFRFHNSFKHWHCLLSTIVW